MHHAVILSGSGEAVKRRSRDMAAAALCEGTGERPCRNCRHCRKVFRGDYPGIHPDVTLIERTRNKKGVLRQEITVEQIRQLSGDAAILPNESEGKVYIFPEADSMNISAQNAFLKLLEEPPAYVTFLLCTGNPENLLETVRSRCAEERIVGSGEESDPQTVERARGWLEARGDRVELLRCCLAMEKLEVPALLDVVRAVMALAPEEKMAPGELLELEAFLRRAEEYLLASIGGKHVTGYLSTYSVKSRK